MERKVGLDRKQDNSPGARLRIRSISLGRRRPASPPSAGRGSRRRRGGMRVRDEKRSPRAPFTLEGGRKFQLLCARKGKACITSFETKRRAKQPLGAPRGDGFCQRPQRRALVPKRETRAAPRKRHPQPKF